MNQLERRITRLEAGTTPDAHTDALAVVVSAMSTADLHLLVDRSRSIAEGQSITAEQAEAATRFEGLARAAGITI